MSNKPCRTVTGCRELHDLPLVAGVSSERHFGSVLICPKDIWVPLLIGVQGQFDGARSSSFITLSSPTARSQKRRLAALDCSDAAALAEPSASEEPNSPWRVADQQVLRLSVMVEHHVTVLTRLLGTRLCFETASRACWNMGFSSRFYAVRTVQLLHSEIQHTLLLNSK